MPLEYWRGEKFVYGRSRSDGGAVLVPPIREIIRKPKEITQPLGKRKRAPARARIGSKVVQDVQIEIVPVDNPEEGWDDDTDSNCRVLDFPSQDEVQRRTSHFLNIFQ
jgi:centromere protein C